MDQRSLQQMIVWAIIALYPKQYNFSPRRYTFAFHSKSRNALVKFLLAISRWMSLFTSEETDNMFFKVELCLTFRDRKDLLFTKNGMRLLSLVALSRSQLGQELLAYLITPNREGFFVEAGAADGLAFSNTRCLEELYGWSGILCEPSKTLALHLRNSSRRASKDFRALHGVTGMELSFLENADHLTLSSLDICTTDQDDDPKRKNFSRYTVSTVSLLDLLRDHGAPLYVDFLSLDTEGNEFDILNSFDFSIYKFGLICVEHNSAIKLQPIDDLLSRHGYSRLRGLQSLSGGDAWFVSSRIPLGLIQNSVFF
jgi:FkbM family methyltransferase